MLIVPRMVVLIGGKGSLKSSILPSSHKSMSPGIRPALFLSVVGEAQPQDGGDEGLESPTKVRREL